MAIEGIWKAQPGAQWRFLRCRKFEALIHGTRGGGKTDALLMAFAQFVGPEREQKDGSKVGGWGPAWRGIIFRETYPQLEDLAAKSQKWFRRAFPGAKFTKGSPYKWEFETGEVLYLARMRTQDDYWNYHGHEYPFIGWEELTNWADDGCYTSMFSCCRSSMPGMPRMIRSTTNPYGKGHNWVKARFALAGQWWKDIDQERPVEPDGSIGRPRTALYSSLAENLKLLEADPYYEQTLIASASSAPQAEAWRRGNWDIVAGGMFDDVWNPRFNDVPRFNVPATWRLDRAFDWGSSKPFSVGWYARSDGSDLRFPDGRLVSTVRGDIFRVKEWYGCLNGRANEGVKYLAVDIAKGIAQREVDWGWRTTTRNRVNAGPADSSIFNVENGMSVAQDMAAAIRLENKQMYRGVAWLAADKSPGSRKMGWETMRKFIKQAHPNEDGLPRERPGLFVIGDENPHFLRTVLSLPRDEKDMDDVDTDAEDHIGDEVRYRVRAAGAHARTGTTVGMY